MFRFAVSKNAERLADYHGEGSPANVMQLVEGRSLWMGLGSEILGIANSPCLKSQMLAVSSGKHPETKRQLTPSNGQRANRRVAFDCVFAAPKPVSLLALIAGDGRALAAHTRAVHAALLYMESMATVNDPDLARPSRPFTPTGNVVAAHLLHTHSRRSLPHLHSHIVLFNLSFERQRRRWLALQAKPIFKHVPTIQRIYHSELALQMRHAGYAVESHRAKLVLHDFPQELIPLFSSNDEIRAEALERYQSTKLSSLKWANDSSRPGSKAVPESLELDVSRWRNSVADPALLDRLFACVPPYPEEPPPPPDHGNQMDQARAIAKEVTIEHFERNLFLRPDAIFRETLARSFGRVSPVAVFRSVQQFFTEQRARITKRLKASTILHRARALVAGQPAPRLDITSPSHAEPLRPHVELATVAFNSTPTHGRRLSARIPRDEPAASRTGAVRPSIASLSRADDIALDIIGTERAGTESRTPARRAEKASQATRSKRGGSEKSSTAS